MASSAAVAANRLTIWSIHVAAEIHVLLAEKFVTLNCLHRATAGQAERRYSGKQSRAAVSKARPTGTGHSPKSIPLLRSGTGLAVKVNQDKGDSEQRLENPLQHI